ncbi:Mov34/MPN/PAD-1 family protein [Pararhodospirillum oryzae]|uniref:JAB domain-containing protein n=1 Tax=Pararhodospirillum oryzae TaxID=478448 RepID=A0A512H714_9PROT|nr:M67 family metallopeptidase [Pararhodospirillum oryzae]GEO81242.1 hypothetical protein ROR02_13730 [Pararhodospirillum oryzae]
MPGSDMPTTVEPTTVEPNTVEPNTVEPTTVEQVSLPFCLAQAMTSAARAAFPEEACGLLSGRREGAWVHVHGVHPVVNAAVTPRTGFAIPPEHRLALTRALRPLGQTVVGHWHSHPGGHGAPSGLDGTLAAESGLVWIIVGVPAPGARALPPRAFLALGPDTAPPDRLRPLPLRPLAPSPLING